MKRIDRKTPYKVTPSANTIGILDQQKKMKL